MLSLMLLLGQEPRTYAEKVADSGAEPNRVFDSGGMEIWQIVLIFFAIAILWAVLSGNDKQNMNRY